jgi:hypothetical protein
MGCYNPSPLKEISTQDLLEEGKAEETMKDALIVRKRGYRDCLKDEYFSVSHAPFSSVRG